MNRFKLEPEHWYAAEIIGDEFDFTEDGVRSYTPIKVYGVVPRGNRTYELSFYHANYPEGVRDKVYTLRTIEREQRFILAHSTGPKPTRYMLVYSITAAWLRRHFGRKIRDDENVEAWLSRNV